MEFKVTFDTNNSNDIDKISDILKINKDVLIKLVTNTSLAKNNSYSPYSKFRVGSCILTTTNELFSGCNVENISYGLSICAERSAIISAVSQNIKIDNFYALSVTTDREDFLTPCGSCRQFIVEFSSFKHIILLNNQGLVKLSTPEEMLTLWKGEIIFP